MLTRARRGLTLTASRLRLRSCCPATPNQKRVFLNRIVAGADRAFDVDAYKQLVSDHVIPRRAGHGRFDGSLYNDATGLVVTEVETGHQRTWPVWERLKNLPPDDDSWMVPVVESTRPWTPFSASGRCGACTPTSLLAGSIDRWAGTYGAERRSTITGRTTGKTAFSVKVPGQICVLAS